MKQLFFWIMILGAFLSVPAGAEGSKQVYTLYLVRHAEKVSAQIPDPGLTYKGKSRAGNLATWLTGRDIRAAWSSDYRRTRATAQPTAARLGLEIRLYDPRKQFELVQQLTTEKQNALVVGHSNTIPELASALCDCETEAMDESEHDRLYVIRINGNAINTEVLDQSGLFNRP